jgi:hypothetical protein
MDPDQKNVFCRQDAKTPRKHRARREKEAHFVHCSDRLQSWVLNGARWIFVLLLGALAFWRQNLWFGSSTNEVASSLTRD